MLVTMFFYFCRLFFFNSLTRVNLMLFINRFFLNIIVFFLLIPLITFNILLNYYSDQVFLTSLAPSSSVDYLGSYIYDTLLPTVAVNLNLVQVYTYPFIYVFLIVTVLSVVFCLSYNSEELMAFMFYCQVILVAGYILFFSESLILFF